MSDTKTDTKISAAELRLQHTIEQQDRQIEKLTEQLKETLAALNAAEKRSDLLTTLTGPLINSGVLPDVVEIMAHRAAAVGEWETDPSGRVRRRDAAGTWHEDIAEFVKPIREKLPSYFVDGAAAALINDTPSVSSGNVGSNGGGNTAVTGRANPWSREGWSDAGQVAAYNADPVKAEQLAAAAGSRIGALNPP